MAKVKTRLFVTSELRQNQSITLNKQQSHFLKNVLRLQPGDSVALFNGQDGEWFCEIEALAKSSSSLRPIDLREKQKTILPLRLAFAPIKKDPLNFMIEKATELGTTIFQPVTTAYTNVERVRIERLQANAIEAAEQCGRHEIPHVEQSTSLPRFLDGWSEGNPLFACLETGDAQTIRETNIPVNKPLTVLIGPEGGFSNEELENLRNRPFVVPISLGPRILRAETAAVAALTLIQTFAGDWDTRSQKTL